MEFSPDEKCIISYSSREPSNPNEKAGLLLNVYDCATGQRLRSFEGSIDDYAVGSAATSDGSLKWPIFKWAANTCAPYTPCIYFLPVLFSTYIQQSRSPAKDTGGII